MRRIPWWWLGLGVVGSFITWMLRKQVEGVGNEDAENNAPVDIHVVAEQQAREVPLRLAQYRNSIYDEWYLERRWMGHEREQTFSNDYEDFTTRVDRNVTELEEAIQGSNMLQIQFSVYELVGRCQRLGAIRLSNLLFALDTVDETRIESMRAATLQVRQEVNALRDRIERLLMLYQIADDNAGAGHDVFP